MKTNNELIAEFDERMSFYTPNNPTYKYWKRYKDSTKELLISEHESKRLMYDKSWDWLVPVYKQCYDIWIKEHKDNQYCREQFESIWQALWKADIKTLVEEVVLFIKWYNNEKRRISDAQK